MKHLKDNNLTYFQHFKGAMAYIVQLQLSVFVLLVHAIVPCVWEMAASDKLERLLQKMQKKKYTLDHIALNAEDIERAIEWYKSNLNADVEYQDESWAMLDIGGTKLALAPSSAHPQHIAFRVGSVEEIPSEEIKTHRDGSKYVYAVDSEKNTVEFIYWPKPFDNK